ncbi:MAG: N-acetylmuramoyl-L-alanine amidase [Kangiellaceae bacterium]|nr:N-acetylmuramoyl-L-alanine amidase [Kangiellaceae bacterium]
MKLCALVIGHKKNSPGASNANFATTEFDFNEKLAIDIEKQLTHVAVQRVYRRTYRLLPDDINQLDPDFIISLHCNAFNQATSGTEVLYYYRSQKGKQMAIELQSALVRVLKLEDRGIKSKKSEDRGGFLLKYTSAPCVIVEPFFIDNDLDLETAQKNYFELVTAYCEAISEIASQIDYY